MDPRRFDNLTRTLGEGTSRRQALKSLATGAAGGVAALFARPASAAPSGKGGGKGKVDCCPTTSPTLCGVTCTDTLNDSSNCGTCNNACGTGTTCINGQCTTTGAGDGSHCSSDTDCANGHCVNLVCCNTACDQTCSSCASGACTPYPSGTRCGAPTCVNGNETTLVCDGSGTCVQTIVSCGNYICSSSGACLTTCSGDSDCATGNICSNGNCVAACPSGQTNCSGACVNLQTDPRSCGTCGNTCNLPNATAGCVNGQCTIVSCNSGYLNCDGTLANGCEYAGTTCG